MRKLEPGGSNHSFGIHVARMAGMPQTVVLRAKDLLKELEKLNESKSDSPGEIGTNYQMSLVQWGRARPCQGRGRGFESRLSLLNSGYEQFCNPFQEF